ncbi:hypothetical protein BH24PSE2_BH24PSE2_24370 [soil metagenome]
MKRFSTCERGDAPRFSSPRAARFSSTALWSPVTQLVIGLVARCDERQPLLARSGLAHLALFILLAFLMPLDDRSITGVNIWLKPAKFALAIGTYLLTMAWFLGELRPRKPLVSACIWTIAVAIAASMWSTTIKTFG